MASEGQLNDTNESVQTYVPAYQKKTWRREAEELDMNLSEFVRSMVQAGRSELSLSDSEPKPPSREKPRGDPSSRPDPRGKGLEDGVVSILEEGEFRGWDEIVDALQADMEDRLERTLQELQARDRVRHSGRNGGYTLE